MNRASVRRYRNIFIVGLPGVGKTSFGMAYAAHTSRSFYDLDRMIEMEQGRSIAEIFADSKAGGEGFFRDCERQMLQKLATRQNVVVSLGGGAACSEEAQELLKEHGLVVQLADDLSAIAKRLLHGRRNRPLFHGAEGEPDVLRVLQELQAARQPWYDRAHLKLDLRFSSLDAAKLELASFEQHAFKRVYQQELQDLGETLPEAPDLQVQMRSRYVLRERPYLALVADFSKSGPRPSSKGRRSAGALGAGKAKRSRTAKPGQRKKTGPDAPPQSLAVQEAVPPSEPSSSGQASPGGQAPRRPSTANRRRTDRTRPRV
jgi:shikimate kinase